MQFQVPQFIEVEDKVFGPLTFRQFFYLAGGAGLCFIFYVYLPIYISIFFILLSAGFALGLTFYKHNGREAIFLVESAFKYAFTKKLYLWKKSDRPALTQKSSVLDSTGSANLNIPRLSESKLKELSWSLDVRDNPSTELGASKQDGF
ncbi:MAG: PrgI family protein [Candidatus Paceibacterota bacterium]|jgi:hypothetical protein